MLTSWSNGTLRVMFVLTSAVWQRVGNLAFHNFYSQGAHVSWRLTHWKVRCSTNPCHQPPCRALTHGQPVHTCVASRLVFDRTPCPTCHLHCSGIIILVRHDLMRCLHCCLLHIDYRFRLYSGSTDVHMGCWQCTRSFSTMTVRRLKSVTTLAKTTRALTR